MNIWKKYEFEAKRALRTYDQKVNAPPSEVFPLLCPVMEVKWLEGWDYTMIFSESGVAEDDAVFASMPRGERDAIWYVTKRDEEKHEIEFIRITPISWIARLNIDVEAVGNDKSLVHIKYLFTGLDDEGNNFIDRLTEEYFLRSMKFWEKSMNHYLETGEKLQPSTDM